MEIGVVDFDAGGTEIGDVEEFVAIEIGRGRTFVDGAVGGTVVVVIDGQDCGRAAVPSGDGAVFRGEDEGSGLAVGRGEDKSGAAVEDRASGSGKCACGSVFRGRNGDDAIAVDGDDSARASVERGIAGAVVGNPPGATRTAAESPRVD